MTIDLDKLIKADHKHTWHPFTQMSEYTQTPQLCITKGKGSWLYDIQGNRYLDANASNWCKTFGHGSSHLKKILMEQMDLLEQASFKDQTHIPGIELSQKLSNLTQDQLSRIFLTDNGSCAIEAAIKLSLQYWQIHNQPSKTHIIQLKNSYHGDTFGAMAAGNSSFHTRFNSFFIKSHTLPPFHCQEYNQKTFGSDYSHTLNTLESILKKESHTISLFIMEPSIQGPACMQLVPKGFLKKASNLCKKHNVHLVLDEVFVGLGRTGHLFAYQEEEAVPDFLCLSKGLNGGTLPLGATLTKEEIYKAFLGSFNEDKTFFHGHTFASNPLCCSITIAHLNQLEAFLQSGQLQTTINSFGNYIEKYFRNHPYVQSIRQRGLACAIDVCAKDKINFDTKKRTAHYISLLARKKEILMRGVGNSLLFVPPLNISEEEIIFFCERTSQSIIEYIENN